MSSTVSDISKARCNAYCDFVYNPSKINLSKLKDLSKISTHHDLDTHVLQTNKHLIHEVLEKAHIQDNVILTAAILYNISKQCKDLTDEYICRTYGKEIAKLVYQLTENFVWAAMDCRAILIKMADMICDQNQPFDYIAKDFLITLNKRPVFPPYEESFDLLYQMVFSSLF